MAAIVTVCIVLYAEQNNTKSLVVAIVCFSLAGVGITVIIMSEYQRRRELEAARTNYLASLNQLKASPTNADLKQVTLALGRIYSNLTRKKKGVTIYDEMALMNDINAACAGSVEPKMSIAANKSIEQRLASLADLKAKELIGEQEYAALRKKILDEL